MGILRKLIGGLMGGGARTDPSKDPNMIRLFDEFGREMYVAKRDWQKMLLSNLNEARKDPDKLSELLVGALEDGFAADVVAYAEHLERTDTDAARGATILGIVYMKIGRLDDAQRVLEGYIAKHGEDGSVLTNLAKVHSARGDAARTESILWHALEVDPNQENGLAWYLAIHQERGGPAAMVEASRRVAQVPGSWRARVWLAQDALKRKDLGAAEELYTEALEACGRPVPADLLMQMSGDLGNHGQLDAIIRLAAPHFDAAFHGLRVGNNLIKAHFERGEMEEARGILSQLYAQKRPDWQKTLAFWDNELAKKRVAAAPPLGAEKLSVSAVRIEGPVWLMGDSPFSKLVKAKKPGAPWIGVFGSTARVADAPHEPTLQLADPPGELSRALPLYLTEHLHFATDAKASALMPLVGGRSLALFGAPFEDRRLCEFAAQGDEAPEIVVAITLDTRQAPWQIQARVLRRADARLLAETAIEAEAENPGPAAERLAEVLTKILATQANVRASASPGWYTPPRGAEATDYLRRLNQQLAVLLTSRGLIDACGLYGEHNVMDGILGLCLRLPTNATVRMVLARTLLAMKAARPEVAGQYKEKVALLQRRHPLAGEVGPLVEEALAQVFESQDAPGA